jgi:hypothetical protein
MNARRLLPLNVVVTDIQPAPANLAGARSRDGNVSPTQRPQADRPDRPRRALADHHDTAMTELDAFLAHLPQASAARDLGGVLVKDFSCGLRDAP